MDIRLVRGRGHRLWMWVSILIGLALLAMLAGMVLGDPTTEPGRASGANANFGADRAAVVPMRAAPFESAFPLEDRELGRLLRVRGTAESEVVGGSLWVRTTAGRWILMRFEPTAPVRGRVRSGSGVDVVGYLEKISRAEFDAWLDTLNVYLPRPRPGVKFGDLPDSGFIKVDSLFIREYYISVRPEGVAARGSTPDAPPPAATRVAPPVRTPARAPAERNERPAAEPPVVVPEEPNPDTATPTP
jgi:hypothetical protein